VVHKDIGGVFPDDSKQMLITIGIWLAVLQIVRHGLGMWRAYVMRKCSTGIVKRLRDDVYKHAQYLPMSFYDKTSTGSVINRISSDSSTLQAFMLRITQDAVVEFFRMIGIIVIMLIMSPRLALYSLVPVPFVVVGSRIFSKKIAPYYRRIWRKWTGVSSALTDTIPGIRVIKSFTNEKNATERFEKRNQEWYDTNLDAGKILSIYPSTVLLLMGFGSVIIWVLGGLAVLNGSNSGVGEITAGLLVSFISYASMFYEPVNFFATMNDSFQNALSSAERIFDILDAEPEADFGKGNIPEGNFKGKIEFKNLSFSFDRTKKVLKNVNISIEPGDIVGIVGTTGSGKSTLVNLFMRYYDNYEGQILIDGQDIRTLEPEKLRQKFGTVFQNDFITEGTIAHNIRFFRDLTPEDLQRAARDAQAEAFIGEKEGGMDADVVVRGNNLSGGQKQRLLIARALASDPEILILDDASSALDYQTDANLRKALRQGYRDTTTLLIAQRVSSLRHADLILVMHDGQVLGAGDHDHLMETCEEYRHIAHTQMGSGKEAI